jgi:hypothetical protein
MSELTPKSDSTGSERKKKSPIKPFLLYNFRKENVLLILQTLTPR